MYKKLIFVLVSLAIVGVFFIDFQPSSKKEDEIDLTQMSATMIYSTVSDMVVHPEQYQGKIVKMTGRLGSSMVEDELIYGVVIQDATACCAQGIEIKEGLDVKKYALGQELTVQGVLGFRRIGPVVQLELYQVKEV